MSQPRTYTERIAVRITTELRDSLRERIAIGVGAAMRNSALQAIGRDDLVLNEARGEIERHARSQGDWVTVGVNVTKQQKRALVAAAKEANVALSALLRDSLVAELGLPKPKASARGGWPLGARKSGRPAR